MMRAMMVLAGLVLASGLALAAPADNGNGNGNGNANGNGNGNGNGNNNAVVDSGRKSGLVAHYFKDPTEWDGNWKEGQKPTADAVAWTFREYKFSRIEPLVNHWFIRRGWFSVRWVGSIDLAPGTINDKDGTIKLGDAVTKDPVEVEFDLWADDGARLFVETPDANGVVKLTQVINDWRNCDGDAPESHRKAKVKLGPGPHKIVIEYFQGESLQQGDKDPCKLSWSCDARKTKSQIVSASHFSHTDADLQDFEPSTKTDAEKEADKGITPVLDQGGKPGDKIAPNANANDTGGKDKNKGTK
jgi:hypothetical protein